jgi:hypothetical protein
MRPAADHAIQGEIETPRRGRSSTLFRVPSSEKALI